MINVGMDNAIMVFYYLTTAQGFLFIYLNKGFFKLLMIFLIFRR